MRKGRWVFGAALLMAASVAALAGLRTVTYKVEGMSTAAQAQKLESAVKGVPGVLDTAADPGAKVLIVRYDGAKCSVADIGDAALNAGFSVVPVVPGKGQPGQGKAKTASAMTEFQQVMQQCGEFIEKDRFGVVRNLMPAMKLRRDALLSAQKQAAALTKQGTGAGSPYALAQELSKAVDELAAAGEARDKARVESLFPKVKKSYHALAKAENFDEAVSAEEPVDKKPKSIQEELKEKIQELMK